MRSVRSPLCNMAGASLVACALVAASPTPGSTHPRLSREVVPTEQAVRLILDAGRSDYTGSTEIALRVSSRATSFELNALGMTIERVALSGSGGGIAATHATGAKDRLTITPERPLPPGDYTLEIAFSRPFGTQALGLYRLETGGAAYAFTQFEADQAREAFPCWDEPEFKIPWRITLVVPEAHLAVSNTPIERESVERGIKTVVFRRSKPMPSYLVAMATGPLESVPITGMSVPGRVVTVKGATGLAGEAVRMTPPIVAALERYFGSPYPYEKLDLIGVPEFIYGAMENAGAITFADRGLLLDPSGVSPQQRLRLSSTIAHEVAHMWFGDLVTMRWWDDLWLNESFASWLGDKITGEIHPEFDMDVRELDQATRAFATDARPSTRAIRQSLGDDVNLEQLADELAYDKGQLMLGMFEQWMGDETFRNGVVDYIGKHAWGNAAAGDLWDALGRASRLDIGSAMTTFLDQPGVPLVAAEWSGNRVTLRQRRLLPHGVEAPAPQIWRIPVVLRFSDGARTYTQSVLLTEREQTFALEPKVAVAWLHPNADERGYYRWLLGERPLFELASLAPRVLNPRERVGLIGNLGALLDAGEIHGDAYLRILATFGSDPNPQVVNAVCDALERARLNFVTPELQEPFARFVRATLGPALDRLGLAPRSGEGPADAELRAVLVNSMSDAGRDADVRAWAKAQAASYLEDPTSVDPSLADAVVRAAAIEGDGALHEAYRRRFETTRMPAERPRMLFGLGGFRDSALFERTLAYAIEGPLRPQEMRWIFGRRSSSDDAIQGRVFEWLVENYEVIAGKLPPESRANLPRYAGGCAAQRLEAARAFFSDPARKIPGTGHALAKVADQVMECVDLRAREGAAVSKFLRSEVTATAP